MIAKCFTYPPATTPKWSIFTPFTLVAPSSRAVPKADSILPISCLPFRVTFPSPCLKHAPVYFCQSLPDLLRKHQKPSLIRSVHKPPKPWQDFSPSKGWDQSQWHCQPEQGHGGSQRKMGRLKPRHSSPSRAVNENRSPFSSGSHLFS